MLSLALAATGAHAADDAALRELALALTAPDWGAPAEVRFLLAGELPDEPLCRPPKAMLLGGLAGRETRTLVYRVAAPGDPALAACEAELRAAGWLDPPEILAGLQDTETPHALCKGDRGMTLGLGRIGDVAYLKVSGPTRSWECNEEVRSAKPFGSEIELPIAIPRLTAPAGATTSGRSGSMGSGGVSQSQTVAGGGSASELTAHYRAQLEAQGWSFVDQVLREQLGVLAETKTDSKGRRWNAHLIAIQSGSEVNLVLELRMQEDGSTAPIR
jgi:hypothetical protein